MAGKRQHTIPQFILRKFACESRRKEHRAYRYSRTRAPAKENIKNISVEQFFYGRPEESELDARITSLEAEMAPLMERLSGSRESQVPLHEDALPEILAHLSTRTQYVRSFGASVLERLAALMEGLFLDDEVCQILVEKDLERGGTLRECIRQGLISEGAEADKVDQIFSGLSGRKGQWKIVAKNLMEMCPGVVFNSVAEYLKTYRELSAEAVRLGFIDSMSRNLASQPLAKAYEKLHFFLVDSKEPLLLGDSICVFETGGKRRFAPFAGGDDDIRQCYLPLSPSKALLGNHVEARPDFRPQFWNSVVARCSEQFFVSSTELPIDSPIIKDLGIWAGIYTESMWSIRERQLRSSFLSDVRNGIFATDSRAKFVTTTDQLPREKTLVRSIRSS